MSGLALAQISVNGDSSWWGLFMVAFGYVVLGMSWASPRRRAQARATSSNR